jgi:hypothetical protein
MLRITRLVILIFFTSINCLTQSGTTTPHTMGNGNSRLDQMPRDLEIRFALSALPPHLRSKAAAFVLDPEKGYQLAQTGTNGFSCIVGRTEWERADFRNDVYAAMCFDSEGSKSLLPAWMDAAALRAKGQLTAEELKAKISEGFRNGTYRAPGRSGVSYMISPLMRTYPSPSFEDKEVVTMNMPHYMFYAPNVANEEIGGKYNSEFPFILNTGGGNYIILLVGDAEREKINQESQDLVKELCRYRSCLCNAVHLHSQP